MLNEPVPVMRVHPAANDRKATSVLMRAQLDGATGGAAPASQIGPLFRDLRRCLRLSIPDVARRLGTRIDIIEALEAGEVSRLPAWPETVRLVTSYTGLAGIDPRSVLEVISDEIALVRRQLVKAPAERSRALRRSFDLLKARGLPAWHWGAVRQTFGKIPFGKAAGVLRWPIELVQRPKSPARLALACAVLAVLLSSLIQSPVLQASVTGGGLSRVLGSVQEYVLLHTSPKKDGMVWIDVGDPRARRSDKLRPPQQ